MGKKAKDYFRKLNELYLFSVSEDVRGKYIPVCNYYRHKGILGSVKAKVCRKKKCKHYREYIEQQPFKGLEKKAKKE